MRATFAAGVAAGTKISACASRALARRRPPRRRDCRRTPRSRRRPAAAPTTDRLNAPRGLKLPACCNSSSFSSTGDERQSISPAALQHWRVADMAGNTGGRHCDGASINHDRPDAGMFGTSPTSASFSRRNDQMLAHAQPSASARKLRVEDGEAVLLVGPPGSGKSDLVLRLLARGFELVADDQVDIIDGIASCPADLAGLLEVRGLGVVRLPYRSGVARFDRRTGRPSDRMPVPDSTPIWACRSCASTQPRLRRLNALPWRWIARRAGSARSPGPSRA